jgi:hypothetical protein
MMEVRVTFVPQDGLRRQAADSKALKGIGPSWFPVWALVAEQDGD